MTSFAFAAPAPVRPAILSGRRVDFWRAADWAALCPGWRPAAGYWREPRDGALLAALTGCQSDIAIAALRRLGRSWLLSVSDARAADAGRPALWTCMLTPLPPSMAEAILAGGGLPRTPKERT